MSPSIALTTGAIALVIACQTPARGESRPPVGPRAAAEHLAAAIRFRTVSHQDPADDDQTAFAGLRAFLERAYPNVHRSLSREIVNGDGLLYTWKGADASALPVLLMNHQDVVPIEPGTERSWTHPPFDGVIAGGFVWGRGAIDNKGPLIFLMEAVESLLEDGFRPQQTVYLAFGFDEEVGGARGAQMIADRLRGRDVRLRYVLDEGGAIMQGIIPDVKQPIAAIGIAEKGSVSVELATELETGHSSRPPRDTAIAVLVAAIDRLQRRQMTSRLRGAPRRQMETLARYMPLAKRWMLSNLWLFGPLVIRGMEKDPTTNALVRTTTAPTIFEAGVKENVLPSKARAVVNFRILPGDRVVDVLAHVRDAVDDDRVAVRVIERMVSEPSPESSVESEAYRLLEQTIQDLYPGTVVTPSLMIGATDSRHFTALAEDVYRFSPFRIGPEDLTRAHGTDERFEVEQIGSAVEFYRRVLRARFDQ